MENLQDRLDQQGAPDFDREALWQRIERPQPRRRAGWWWLGAVGLALLLLLWKWPFEPAPTLSSFYVGNTAAPYHEMQPEAPLAQQSADHAALGVAGQQPPLDNPASANARAMPSILEKPLARQAGQNGQAQLGAKSVAASRHLIAPSNLDTQREAPALPLPRLALGDGLSAVAKIEPVVPLPTLAIELAHEASLPDFPIRYEPETGSPSSPFPNTFALSSGAAAQFYSAKGPCDWKGRERSLLGFYLSGQYRRALGKGGYALASAQYTAHTGRFDAQLTRSSTAVNLLNQEVRTEETTYYQLYNQYQRIDLSAGLGKTWSSTTWQWSIEASAGYTQWLSINANTVDRAGALQPHPTAEAVPGSWMGRLGASVEKPLSDQWAIGLSLDARTPILLSESAEGCQRRVYPVGVGLVVVRGFK